MATNTKRVSDEQLRQIRVMACSPACTDGNITFSIANELLERRARDEDLRKFIHEVAPSHPCGFCGHEDCQNHPPAVICEMVFLAHFGLNVPDPESSTAPGSEAANQRIADGDAAEGE